MTTIPESWYRESFGKDYLKVYRRRDHGQARREVELVAEALGLAPGERVLDLGCGAGRHLAPLLERGIEAVGLDRSRSLLARARADLDGGALLVLGDMRSLPFHAGFDAVLSFFTSFGYFFDETENRRVISEIARVLLPGGRLLLDLMDRDSVLEGLVPRTHRREGAVAIEERRWISPDRSRVEKEAIVREGEEELRFHESVRLYTLPEVEAALAQEGLRPVSVFGDFAGTAYRPGDTPRMIIHAGRAG